MAIESDELIRQLPASLALPYSLLNYRNARLKTVMLFLISCAYQDGFGLHIPDYLLPETEAPSDLRPTSGNRLVSRIQSICVISICRKGFYSSCCLSCRICVNCPLLASGVQELELSHQSDLH